MKPPQNKRGYDKLKRQAESFSEEIFRKKMIAFIADVLENKV